MVIIKDITFLYYITIKKMWKMLLNLVVKILVVN